MPNYGVVFGSAIAPDYEHSRRNVKKSKNFPYVDVLAWFPAVLSEGGGLCDIFQYNNWWLNNVNRPVLRLIIATSVPAFVSEILSSIRHVRR